MNGLSFQKASRFRAREVVLAAAALAALARAASADDPVASAIDAIAARLNQVQGYAATIRIVPEPTNDFLAKFAADTGQEFSRVRARFTQVRGYDIKTRIGREFFLDERMASAEGALLSRRQHAYDGQHSFEIVFALDKEVPFMDVVVAKDVSSAVGNAIDYFMSGWGIEGSPLLGRRLDKLLLESKVKVEVLSAPSAENSILALRLLQGGATTPSRLEIALEARREYALSELSVAYLIQDSWHTSRKLRVASLIDVADGTTPGVRHMVPNEVVVEVINARGEVTTVETAHIDEIQVNPRFEGSAFTPEIEVGSTVRHAVTKECWVHGGRPTVAMEKAIARRAAQAKADLQSLNPTEDFSHPASPPRRWQDALPWIGAAIGVTALISAVVFRVRWSL